MSEQIPMLTHAEVEKKNDNTKTKEQRGEEERK
jgi:hypothetical protein